ncbi:Uncharacterized protein Y057_12947 [Fusarium fujikuroi]|nr:Uncharacterized protein Y057_12947 [Fusarium fujikuroi]
MKLSDQEETLRPSASILRNKKQSQCATDILDTIPAPTHPSTGTTARRRSSISRRVMRRRVATYRSRQPSPRRPTTAEGMGWSAWSCCCRGGGERGRLDTEAK